MFDKMQIEGATTRCEICGNHYALDYIVFHQQNRCLKSTRDARYLSDPPQSNPSVPLTSLIPAKNEEDNLNKVVYSALKSQKQKTPCPYCKMLIKRRKYEAHITENCPILRQKRKETPLSTKIGKATKNGLRVKPLKKRNLSPAEDNKKIIQVIVNRVRCSKCHFIYAKAEIECPECLRVKNRKETLIICKRCDLSFDEDNYNKHLRKCFDPEVSCLICRQVFSKRNFQLHSHLPKKVKTITPDAPNEIITITSDDSSEKEKPNSPSASISPSASNETQKETISLQGTTQCDFCKSHVKLRKLERHLANSCPKMIIECEICKEELLRGELINHRRQVHKIQTPSKQSIKKKPSVLIKALAIKRTSSPRRCRICGRIAMYNSGHCYSCGDK